MAPGTDETARPNESTSALVTRLARTKASGIAAQRPGAWVIGSDQLAARTDETGAEFMLGKPGTETRCIEQLQSSSGRSIVFLTAVALMNPESGSLFEFTDTTRVRFRPLDQATIERYVAKERPLDCAGGFKSEGLGITLCESIDSTDPTALIGLPLIRLSAALRAAGFEVP